MYRVHDIYSKEIGEAYLEYCHFFNRINEIMEEDKNMSATKEEFM
ncbi:MULTISPECIES: hypothetical protein [Elizabethkingia]|nr:MULTISPECIES: hypothetical protein [Elizabethkingia]KMU64422.1 hypothetical protein EZBTHKR_0724 [Elizabethkingia anophelis]MCS7371319.1 hypothetical protein [Elizabethkingia anophelis]MCS7376658.1 hypothetical protein [Elizabethkingia anophelis]MCS7389506.1 hypothetical protein [Elizabethkingia anophelis]MDX8555737.1 hypothetical protein [Elizabethkingia sp. HX CGY]